MNKNSVMTWRYRVKRGEKSGASDASSKRTLGGNSFRGIRRAALVVGYTALVILLSVFVFLHISQYVTMTEIKFSISRLRKQSDELDRRIQTIRFDFEKMASVTAIESEASGRLGMVHASEILYVPWSVEGISR